MKLSDMVRQSLQNLSRHKGRTFLTILGVIVGCCSVVALVSIGIGYSQVQHSILEQMGDLTKITVSIRGGGTARVLDKTIVRELKSLEHVSAVIPYISFYECSMTVGNGGRYKADYFEILGEDFRLAQIDGYVLEKGEWDDLGRNDIVIGEYFAYELIDLMRPDGKNKITKEDYYNWDTLEYEDLPEPYMDLMNKTITLTFGITNMEESDTGSNDPSAEKSYSVELNIAGILKNASNDWGIADSGVLMDLETLQDCLDKYTTMNSVKRQSEKGYDSITVKVDNIENVESVEKDIQRMQLDTFSLDDTRKSMEQMVRQTEFMLGGIGAIALFVASLGIANTMIMAITERTREIGIMKALGCFLRNIREMFLLEAGFIGLFGGLIGIGISFLISVLLNTVGMNMIFTSEYDYLVDTSSMDISVIPWWLAVFAVIFAVLVGIVAGLYPAEKAVRTSVLEAIRHE